MQTCQVGAIEAMLTQNFSCAHLTGLYDMRAIA